MVKKSSQKDDKEKSSFREKIISKGRWRKNHPKKIMKKKSSLKNNKKKIVLKK